LFLELHESEGGPYFFRLQCLSGQEVTEWAQWQLLQRTREQSGIILDSATFSLNLAKTKDSHAKCCSITVLPFAANVLHSIINNLSFRPFPKPQRKAECLKALKEIALEPGMNCVGYAVQ